MPIIKAKNGPFDGQDIYVSPAEFQNREFFIKLYNDNVKHWYTHSGYVTADDSDVTIWNYVGADSYSE